MARWHPHRVNMRLAPGWSPTGGVTRGRAAHCAAPSWPHSPELPCSVVCCRPYTDLLLIIMAFELDLKSYLAGLATPLLLAAGYKLCKALAAAQRCIVDDRPHSQGLKVGPRPGRRHRTRRPRHTVVAPAPPLLSLLAPPRPGGHHRLDPRAGPAPGPPVFVAGRRRGHHQPLSGGGGRGGPQAAGRVPRLPGGGPGGGRLQARGRGAPGQQGGGGAGTDCEREGGMRRQHPPPRRWLLRCQCRPLGSAALCWGLRPAPHTPLCAPAPLHPHRTSGSRVRRCLLPSRRPSPPPAPQS